MGIITDYLDAQKKYEQQYGERTVVLMEIGNFYEIYEYDPSYCTSEDAKVDSNGKVWNEHIGHAVDISVVLNCVLTYEDGSKPYGIKSPHKIGFPNIAIEKNRTTLLANDYTVIRIDQVKGNKGKETERYLAEICSPTMQLDHITTARATSNVACIYIEYHQGMNPLRNHYENFVITTGAAVIDIITGNNRVCEFYSKAEDQIHAVQELYRFLIAHYPRELIVHVNDLPPGLDKHNESTPNPYIKYLEKVLELKRFDRMNVHVNSVISDYKKISYQIEVFNKLFYKNQSAQNNKGLTLNVIQIRNDKIIEELGLERMNYGRIAYLLLMQHCHSYNSDIITKLSKPDLQWIDEHKHLILAHNAIVQLDLIPNNHNIKLKRKTEIDSLMSVLDHNQTHLGRRVLHTLLQNPMLNSSEIQSYYDMVDEMSTLVNETDTLWMLLDKYLKELPDVGRLQRKLEIKLISPKELAVLFSAYIKIINMYILILNTKTPVLHTQMLTQTDVSNFNQFIAKFSGVINFTALESCRIDSSSESGSKWLEFNECPVKPGYYTDIDLQAKSLSEAEFALQQIVDHLNNHLSHTRGKKIQFKSANKKQGATKREPSDTILTTTTAKANELSMTNIDINLCGQIQVLPYNSSERMITSDKINYLSSLIDTTKAWMRHRLLNIYDDIIHEMTTKYTFFVPIASLIAKLDLLHSYAKVSSMYNYFRPEIVTNDNNPSYVEAREIRHPIIERIIDNAYVTNDVMLGGGYTNDDNTIARTNGMLLYGINTSGKTSLGKAVALNIIMAQMGCFVPSRLKYKPYTKIITRLTGSDNLFKGSSSFAIEMEELRTILRQADNKTLIVGDEICSGTETNSGMTITCSAITTLVQRQSTFLFATHLHEIIKLSCITNLSPEKLYICHLSITYDDNAKVLVYDRKIKPGSGPSIYGLMVAKALHLPDDFLETANSILLEILGENDTIVSTKKSKYNSKIYVDSCSMCGKTSAQTELHTHHIKEQSKADENKLIDNVSMNIKNNLIVLCRDCHTNLHNSNTELESVTVPNGAIVRIKPSSPEHSIPI